MSLRRTLLRLVSQRLRDQRGIALITAVLTLAVLSSMGATVVVYSSSGFRSAAHSDANGDAYALADAGLDMARATLYNTPSFQDPNAVPQQTVSLNGGTATYAGSLAGTTWTLTSTGSVQNPTGGGTSAVTRTVSTQVAITTGLQSSPNNAVWNYLYSDSLTTCMSPNNNISITAPLYVRGNLCMSNNATISSPVVEVGGTVTISNNASIGTSGSPIQQANIAGGCRYGTSGPFTSPCTSAQRVYAQTITTAPFGYTKPPVDFAYWYANAKPGPMQNCTQGSFSGGFDNNTTMNRSRSTVNLMPSSSYDCRVVVSSQEVGRLSWTPGQGSNCGTLTIAGTIFFDGNISMGNNAKACYVGKGTIYTSGTFTLTNNAYMCGIQSCTSSWDPSQNLLAIIAGGSIPSTAVHISLSNNNKFQGALYAVNDYSSSNNSTNWGPVIARQLLISNSAANNMPLNQLLAGMPATYTTVTTLQTVPGSYVG